MIITCPSCDAKFSLPDSALGSKGRKVRCARCGHVWRQPPPLSSSPPSAARFDADDDPVPVPPPPPVRPPRTVPPLADLPIERDPYGTPPAQDKQSTFEQELSTLESMLGTMTPAAGGKKRGTDSPFDDDAFGDSASRAFDDSASRAFGDRSSRRAFGGDIEDLDTLLSAEDPDPIPRVFTGPRPTRRSGASAALKGVVLGLAILWAVALAGFFLRDTLVALVPALGSLYSALRIETTLARDDVIFQNVVSTLEAQGDHRVLIVRGLLFNPSQVERPVRGLQLVVMDDAGKVLQKVRGPAPQPALTPGAQVPFQIVMENPSPLARDFRILFDTPE